MERSHPDAELPRRQSNISLKVKTLCFTNRLIKGENSPTVATKILFLL